jgi:NADH dehydrogenase FAD-containing subunit
VPSSAQDANDQARYLAYAMPFLLKNKKPVKAYIPDQHGFIVNLGGKWAILSYKGFYIKGFLAYLIDEAAHFGYYRSIVGFWKALKFVVFQMEIYSRND